MTSLLRNTFTPPTAGDWTRRRRVLVLAGFVCMASLSLGTAIAWKGPSVPAFLGAAFAYFALLWLGLRDWRWSVYALLLFIPFTGIPTVLLYPNTGPAALVGDAAFVIPAYLGFLVDRLRRHQPLAPPNAPLGLLLLFAGVVVAQVFNPNLPNHLVGLIGLRVWLFYVPLYFLGYWLVESKRDLVVLLRRMCLVAIVPTVVSLLEAVLIYSGHSPIVYRFYGKAAAAVTQNFATTHYLGGGELLRIPSTFSFNSQYNLFAATMVALGYAWVRWNSNSRSFRSGAWLLFIAAALLTGSRGSFLTVGVLLVIVIAFSGQVSFLIRGAAAFGAAIFGAGALLHASLDSLYGLGWELLTSYLRGTFMGGLAAAVSHAPLGLGTGMDTGAARYAFPTQNAFVGLSESWYAKIIYELGIPGCIVLLTLMIYLVATSLRHHNRLVDPDLRATSAALLGLAIWALLYGTKAEPFDIVPLNMYFWLFWGILARIGSISRGSQISTGNISVFPLQPRRPDLATSSYQPSPPGQP